MVAELTLTATSPRWVVAAGTARRAARSGALWGLVFGLTVASSALGYASAYKTTAQRERLTTLFGTNAGLAAINGPASQLQTVPGYTVWKSFMFLIVLGSVWGLLLGTRLFRGEEDAGRWELLLAGQTTRRGAARQALVGLGAGLAALWAVTAVIVVSVGRSAKVQIGAGDAAFFSLALVAAPAMWLALGAVTSQLAATRRQAASYAAVVLGVAYGVRMVADSSPPLEWLRWASPLGWVEQLRPITDPHPAALAVIAVCTLLLAAAAVHLAAGRDLAASVLPDRAVADAHTRLLSGPAGLAVRLSRPAVAGWAVAIGASAALLGSIAKQGGSLLSSSASIERAVGRLGLGAGNAAAYLGFTFLMLAVLVAFVAAGQVGAIRDEEASGHLDQLLVRPLSRLAWLGGRLATVVGAVLGCAVLAGILAWAAAAGQHTGIGFSSMLTAGINLVPPAVCVLGAGVLALGFWPRATSGAAYGLLGWSALVEIVGGFGSSRWLLDTSVFHQMAPAPASSPDWASAAVLIALGGLAMAAGAVGFRRRDLAGA